MPSLLTQMLLAPPITKSHKTPMDPRPIRNTCNSGNTPYTIFSMELLGTNHRLPGVEFNCDHDATHQPSLHSRTSLQCTHDFTCFDGAVLGCTDRAHLLVHIDS